MSGRPRPTIRIASLQDLPCKSSRPTRSGLLLREAKERPRAIQGHARLRRRVDLHGDLRRHEAGSVLARRGAHRRRRRGVPEGSGLADGGPHPAVNGRPPDVHRRPSATHSVISVDCGADPEGLRAPTRHRERQIQPASLRRDQPDSDQGRPRPEAGSRPATSSGRTSRCGWGCGGSRG